MQIDTSTTSGGGGGSWWDVGVSFLGALITALMGWWVQDNNGLHVYHAVGTMAGCGTIVFTLVRMVHWVRKHGRKS
jgi:hypothetical protein